MPELPDIATETFLLLNGAHAFNALAPAELQRLASRATETKISPGSLVVREGDAGDRMYLIANGSLQVLGRAFDESELVLARLEPGQYFGEQALLSHEKLRRNASVRAITNCRLFVITHEDLLTALDENSELLRRLREAGENQKGLRRSQLREQVLRNLGVSGGYRIEAFQAGDWIFRQGAQGDRVYLVIGGSAKVIRSSAGEDTVLATLLPGQFFGELAILNDAPRAASVQAETDLEVASLDGSWFRSAVSNNSQLRSIMSSLESMYLLPNRGMLTLQAGKLGTQSTLTAVHHLTDGRCIVSTRLVDAAAFTARVIGASEATQSARYADADGTTVREIHIADGKIVEIEAEGAWPELGEVLTLLLDQVELSEAQIAMFEAHGDFRQGEAPVKKDIGIVCQCSGVTAQKIAEMIDEGCHTLQQVAAGTKATLVCGGCIPTVNELLGQADWTPARCEHVTPLNPEIRAFRIRPMDGSSWPSLPGQHLVLRARIDNNWIQRPYTISSPPADKGDYEITVKREPEGTFSRWLFDQMPPNALLRISKPAGNYCLAADRTGSVVCFVGGIGITPALAMVRNHAANLSSFRLHIDYSASGDDQIIRREELVELSRTIPYLTVTFRITRKEGRITQSQIKQIVHDHPAADYYLCASRPFMDSVRDYLAEAGVPIDRIHMETFTAAGERSHSS